MARVGSVRSAESGIMGLEGLLILLQYLGSAALVIVIFFVMLIVFAMISLVCVLMARSTEEGRRRNRDRPVYRFPTPQEVAEASARTLEEEAPSSPSFSRSPSSGNWTAADTPSSPVGGTCLACGATVTEETSPTCSKCGAERQRCSICQRYVAGGQDLLACVHCRAPGHANEMLAWVEQHETCPYCARRIDRDELKPLQDLTRVRRRKP